MTILQIQADWTINIGHIIWLFMTCVGIIAAYWDVRIRLSKLETQQKSATETSKECRAERVNDITAVLKSMEKNYDKIDKKLNYTNEKVHELHVMIVENKDN